jgi:hypothetical protein
MTNTVDFKHTKTLWAEDDARPPDAETLRQAYRRIFGCDKPKDELLEDCGDHLWIRNEHCIVLIACDGCELRELPEEWRK